jgi:hypothetical protein
VFYELNDENARKKILGRQPRFGELLGATWAMG